MQVKTSSTWRPNWRRVLHAIRREKRQSIMRGKIDKLLINTFLSPQKMPLDFNKNLFPAEDVD
jgi:hypothetical protein